MSTRLPRPILCVVALIAFFASALASARPAETVVVNARVFNNYQRIRLPDGSTQPERYGLADGGRWDGKHIDHSLDDLPFAKIARLLTGPLRDRAYLPSADPKQTDLLILVFHGVTTGATHGDYDHALPSLLDAMNASAQSALTNSTVVGDRSPSPADDALYTALLMQQGENRDRDRNNLSNARILGYFDAYLRARDLREIGSPAGDNVFTELEADRYFVVLKAYDFRALREKKMKLLWEARFSVYEQGNRFDEQLPAMAQAASRYFGQDTDGLVRGNLPEVKIDLGPATVVETLEQLPPPPKP